MNDSHELVERTISSKEVFSGRLLHVFFDEVSLPDGSRSTREWIKHPGAAAVLPVFENGDIMMVRQFRYPMGQIFLEVPAGKIDPCEEAGSTARRELKEEAGLTCEHYQYLGRFYPGIGYSDEIIHLYIAWDITSYEQQVDEDEFLLKKRLSFRKAVEMVHSGEIADGKSMVTLLRGWHWWQEHQPFSI
ncbi:NUDIX domain-containing protein [Fodinibius sediminis]|uniref:GDP-mannose pyrophosphatase n=1 Tax=Fodinibius sediminis TaxID=1214077 RepID=A0A521BHW3_9BACT|nr:NUDIX hydrolase [Fodinibius sediminis]SMO46673.1 ADP-ribose pyrophosphatase [Fodinibius sediminis]